MLKRCGKTRERTRVSTRGGARLYNPGDGGLGCERGVRASGKETGVEKIHRVLCEAVTLNCVGEISSRASRNRANLQVGMHELVASNIKMSEA